MLHLLLALTTAPQAGLFKKPPRDPVYFGYKVDLYLCPGDKIRKAGDPDFGTGPIKEPFTRPLGDGGWLLSPETRETCEVDSAVPAVTLYYTRNFLDPSCPYDCAWPLNDAEKTVVRAALKEALDLGSPQERAQIEEMLAQEAAARAEQQAREEWERALTGTPDCLGGVCLSSFSHHDGFRSYTTFASGYMWSLSVEKCGGQVVGITLDSSYWNEDEGPPQMSYITDNMVELGWEVTMQHDGGKYGDRAEFLREGTVGFRTVREHPTWNPLTGFPSLPRIEITTTHPDKHNLCRAERQQGL